MSRVLGRALVAATLTGAVVLGGAAPALAAPAEPAKPAAPDAPVPGLPALPGLEGLTTILGPAAETGKVEDIAPGGVPIFGLLESVGGLGGKLPGLGG